MPNMAVNNPFPRGGAQFIGFQDHILWDYLPTLGACACQTGMRAHDVARWFASSSEGIEENEGLEGLTYSDLLRAYDWILKVIRRCIDGSEVSAMVEFPLADWAEEEHNSGSRDFRWTVSWFRALCEISRQCESRHLAEAMSRFFYSYGRRIATRLGEAHLYSAYGISRSNLLHTAKIDLLRDVVRHNPDLIDYVDNYHPQRVVRELQDLLSEVLDIRRGMRRGRAAERRPLFYRGPSRLLSPSPDRSLQLMSPRNRARSVP